MVPLHRFRQRLRMHAAGTSDDLDFGKITQPRHYTITHLVVRDATSTPTGAVTILVQGHGYDHIIDEVPAPAAGRAYVFLDEILLDEGETLTVRFAGATAADVLEAFIEGAWWEDPRTETP